MSLAVLLKSKYYYSQKNIFAFIRKQNSSMKIYVNSNISCKRWKWVLRYHYQHPWICTPVKAWGWLGSDLSVWKRCYQEQFFCLYRTLTDDQVLGSMCCYLLHPACPRNPQSEREPFEVARSQQIEQSILEYTVIKVWETQWPSG